MDWVDTAVSRHLQKKFELGLFENPYVDEGRVLEVFETPGPAQPGPPDCQPEHGAAGQ